MLQKHNIAVGSTVRGLLSSRTYRGAEIDAFLLKPEHKQHPATATMMQLTRPQQNERDTRTFTVLDIVPALLLLVLSAVGGVDMDVVRTPDALERFCALYLYARLDALLFCVEKRRIKQSEFLPTLLAPFKCGVDFTTLPVAPGLKLAPLVQLSRPFPPTNTRPDLTLSPPRQLARSKTHAEVVVNGSRAPFADAWLSLPLADGRRFFLAMQAKHVSNATGIAKVASVKDECIKVGVDWSTDLDANALEKRARADAAWWALRHADEQTYFVCLSFLTNGTFDAMAQEAMEKQEDVCRFDRTNMKALVPFTDALTLLHAPDENDVAARKE